MDRVTEGHGEKMERGREFLCQSIYLILCTWLTMSSRRWLGRLCGFGSRWQNKSEGWQGNRQVWSMKIGMKERCWNRRRQTRGDQNRELWVAVLV